MSDGWYGSFEFNREFQEMKESLALLRDAVDLMLDRIDQVEKKVESSEFIGTPPPGAFVPRNWRRFGV